MSTLGDATDVKFGNFWQTPIHRTLPYSLSTPCFVTTVPLAVKPASTPRRLVHEKKIWRDSVPIDMLLSAVSVLVVGQPSSKVPGGLMNYPVLTPWSRVLLEKLTGSQLVKKFPAFFAT